MRGSGREENGGEREENIKKEVVCSQKRKEGWKQQLKGKKKYIYGKRKVKKNLRIRIKVQ